jgi:hypothetical protein
MTAAMSEKEMAGKDPGDFQSPPMVAHAPEKLDTPDTAPATEEAR